MWRMLAIFIISVQICYAHYYQYQYPQDQKHLRFKCSFRESCEDIYDCALRMHDVFAAYNKHPDIYATLSKLSDKPRCSGDTRVCCPFARLVNYFSTTMETPITDEPTSIENQSAESSEESKAPEIYMRIIFPDDNATKNETDSDIKNVTETTTDVNLVTKPTVLTTEASISTKTEVTTFSSTTKASSTELLTNTTATSAQTPISEVPTTTTTTVTLNETTIENRSIVTDIIFSAFQGYEKLRLHPNFHVLAGPHCGFGLFPRVSHGEEVAPGELPWLAMLRYRENGSLVFRCGGALISHRYVLTAAHCIFEPDFTIKLLSVWLGETNLNSRWDCVTPNDNKNTISASSTWCDLPQEIKIEETFPHPKFDYKNALKGYPDDIGLIRLRRAAEFSPLVMPICMAGLANTEIHKFMDTDLKNNLLVAGWGMTNMKQDPTSDALRRVGVSIVPRDKCEKIHRRATHKCQLCAGGSLGNACRGDSGGPLMTQAFGSSQNERCPLMIGVVSFGSFDCGYEIPTVFSDVSCYLPWILDSVRPD